MFTYPFAYTPDSEIVEASNNIISFLKNNPSIGKLFEEGKMLGVLVAEDTCGNRQILAGFSGLAGGRSVISGNGGPDFVPPIFDTTSLPELGEPKTPEESKALQERIFSYYIVRNALGEQRSIKDIFAGLGLTPPGGTGECAAPKMLNEAYRRGLKPLKMGEFWYGASPKSGEIREHGRFYPSCTGKCGPLLTWMMRGLEVEPNPLQIQIDDSAIHIIYEDELIIAADKPSGMLTVPGKTNTSSLKELLERSGCKLYEVHRLDMDTSGIVLFAKTPDMQAELRRQFEQRTVRKTYIAHLAPGARKWSKGFKGTIALPIGSDYYDRPRQMIDREHGKKAITQFEILNVFPDTSMDVRFTPLTGRTHQLRVHSAAAEGLGHPIEGDRLYGAASGNRLMLHAEMISFQYLDHNLTLSSEALKFE